MNSGMKRPQLFKCWIAQRINHYLLDRYYQNVLINPIDIDLSNRQCCPLFDFYFSKIMRQACCFTHEKLVSIKLITVKFPPFWALPLVKVNFCFLEGLWIACVSYVVSSSSWINEVYRFDTVHVQTSCSCACSYFNKMCTKMLFLVCFCAMHQFFYVSLT